MGRTKPQPMQAFVPNYDIVGNGMKALWFCEMTSLKTN